ncbi:hypothetical protein MWH28_02975 [Natroniella sulfidigena]|uniref:hypothetical protein n=1 Tax=Natroniella sulfidigena TaxID=723921 RepID=UPI00200AB3FA|nr:hypothetical protein [Natroniella sulfidigena]MCK8816326.1 hypothetical protein [Natroniella sulfidigena]
MDNQQILQQILSEMKSVKEEVVNVKGEVSNLKGEVNNLKEGQVELRKEFNGMKQRQDEMYHLLKGWEEDKKVRKIKLNKLEIEIDKLKNHHHNITLTTDVAAKAEKNQTVSE